MDAAAIPMERLGRGHWGARVQRPWRRPWSCGDGASPHGRREPAGSLAMVGIATVVDLDPTHIRPQFFTWTASGAMRVDEGCWFPVGNSASARHHDSAHRGSRQLLVRSGAIADENRFDIDHRKRWRCLGRRLLVEGIVGCICRDLVLAALGEPQI